MKLSKNKQRLVELFDKGYRVVDGVCYNPEKRALKSYVNKQNGYVLYHKTYIHQLVAYEKFGDRWLYSNLEVRHLDRNKENNNHANIEIGTSSQNKMDIPKQIRKAASVKACATPGRRETSAKKTREILCKVSVENVSKIRYDFHVLKMRQCDIARKYQTHPSIIRPIVRGLTYKEVEYL